MKRSVLLFGALFALFAAASPAIASDRSEALSAVGKFIQAGNGDSREAYAAYCAADAVIVDHVAPYVFRGPGACLDHWDAVGAFVAQNSMVVGSYAQLGAPAMVDIKGERAYVVAPWTAAVTMSGKPKVEKGVATFVLRRDADRVWRFTNVTWASFGFSPAALHFST